MILKLQNAGKFITTSGSGYIPPSRNIIPSKKSPTAATINQWLKGTFSYITGIKDSDLIESKYRPSKETNTTTKYYTRKGLDYDVMRNLLGGKESSAKTFEGEPLYYKNFNDLYNRLSNKTYRKGRLLRTTDNSHLGEYTIGIGEDNNGRYVSYYDKFDWAPNEKLEIFSPYEIYNRIYEKDFNRMLKELNNETYSGSNPSGNWFFKSGMNNKGYFKFGGKTANVRKWKHLLGGNLLLGPMPSAINNPKVKNILSYMPFTGSAIDIETTMKNPSIKNSINAAISTGSDVLGGWLIRDVNKAKKAYNEAKAAEKTAKELLNLSRKSNVIARSVTEELRRLKDNWEKAYWDLQLKDRLNFILKYLDYPIYGGWLAGDATINYILNLKKGGTLKFLEGGKTSWWNKAISFMNNSGLGEVALNALSTYTLNKLIGASSDVAKALVDKDKASKILQANLAAELEANDIQLNNVNPENPNAMSGDIVKNFIKNKLLSLKTALINLESDLEKAEIDWQTLLLKNLNTTNMWAGIGSTLMQGLGHV